MTDFTKFSNHQVISYLVDHYEEAGEPLASIAITLSQQISKGGIVIARACRFTEE